MRCLDHMGQRRAYFLPTSCFESTVRVDPYALGRENLEDALLRIHENFLCCFAVSCAGSSIQML